MSGPLDWDRVEEVFSGAVDLEPADRDSYLQRVCAGDTALEVEARRLLAADDDATASVMRPLKVGDAALRQPDHRETELTGVTVASYTLVRPLGEGGMGSVWLGTHADESIDRRVAVKVIKRGMDTDEVLRRFGIERRVLASLEHPNIARLIDAAPIPDGRPAIIMEFIDGLPLDTYCDENRLTVRERLELFLRVCAAVEHAHKSLVVHRDLKPSNIYVTADREPKLFDFGIAKLLDDDLHGTQTAPHRRVLTPRYASPEQIRGEAVTTASDVFSLGVVLYELLTGRTPYAEAETSAIASRSTSFDQAPTRPSAAVTKPLRRTSADGSSVEVTPEEIGRHRKMDPSRLRRALVGDLDTILLKALQPDPQRRYGRAGELADDIRRHLENRPVVARPDSVAYLATKFVRRNTGFVVAGSTFVVALCAGVAALAILYTRAVSAESAEAQQREIAEIRYQEADRVAGFLEDMLKSANPDRANGRDPAVLRAILDDAATRIESELADQPRVRRRLEHALGVSYRKVGAIEDSGRHLDEAIRLNQLP